MEIKSFKFIASGDEIVCKVIPPSVGGSITIEDPLMLTIMGSPSGGFGIGWLPWVHSQRKGTIMIPKDQVIELNPDQEVINGYLSQTSGIQVAGGQLLHS